jgi:hypothetical protein
VPTKYRKVKCPISNEPLGTDYSEMEEKAKTLNGRFDEWDHARKGRPVTGVVSMPKRGTVDWLFREYKISKALPREGRSALAPRLRVGDG